MDAYKGAVKNLRVRRWTSRRCGRTRRPARTARSARCQAPDDPGLAVLVRGRPGDRRTSWTAVLLAVRLAPGAGAAYRR